MKIELPWPDPRLSPNARVHWRVKHNAKAPAREAARLLTFSAMQRHLATQAHFAGDDPLCITITFYPPDKRRRDDDNMVGSFKSYRDGIAEALGVDDRRFRPHYFFEDAAKPGKIVVCIGDNSPAPSAGRPSVLQKGRAGSGALTPSGPDQTTCRGGDDGSGR